MERDCSPFPPLQQDEIPMNNIPDFSIWDVGFDQILYDHNDQTNIHEKNKEIEEKKILHREIEKQRRKEMAALYSSLHSVLPSKSIKGMRSASDQIHEATKYIRYMQNKVRQLEIKRDGIKKPSQNGKVGGLLREGLGVSIRVERCTVGVEVLIIAADEGRRLRLSRILQLLFEEGLDVVDFTCTKCDGKLHCTIKSEVVTCPSIDIQMLQGKLTSSIETF